MKKSLKLLLVIVLVIYLSGCAKYDISMGVNKDKSVNLDIIYAIDPEATEEILNGMFGGNEVTKDTADLAIDIAIDETYTLSFACTGYSLNGVDDIVEIDCDNGTIKGLANGISSGTLYIDEENEKTVYITVGTGEKEPSEEEGLNQITPEQYEYLKSKGYTVEEYEEENENGGKYLGIKVSKKYDSIDSITSKDKKEFDFNKVMQSEEGFDDSYIFTKKNNIYSSNILFNLENSIPLDNEEETESEESEELEELLGEMIKTKYIITLPTKAISSNATNTSKDGKTLTWDLKLGEKNKIDFQFKFEEDIKNPQTGDTLMNNIIIAIASMFLLGTSIYFTKKAKKTY